MSDLVYCRGKRENGGWVYGYAVKKAYHNGYYIITHAYSSDRVNATGIVSGAWEGYEDIIPETIGRDTGLTDKNGTKIFEGDIVEYLDERAVVEWDVNTARYIVEFDGYVADFDNLYDYKVEVIGNIHDNPELLGG